MNRALITTLALAFSLTASAAPAAKKKKAPAPAKLPALLVEVEKKYADAATLSADFKQLNFLAALGQKKPSSGTIQAKRPDKLRWETHEPDANILVSDGRTFWFYTPPFDKDERGQVIEKRTSDAQSRLATALLSGRFSVARDMKITQKDDSHFLLVPKPGAAGTVAKMEIEVHPERKVIEKVMLEHKGGNKTEIMLENVKLGDKLGDELFFFTPPPNTDKVEG